MSKWSEKIQPMQDRVVVKRLEAEERTASGIIIPDSAKEKPQEGEVVAVGPGALNEKGERQPVDIQVGDCVMFGKWAATEIKVDGTELLIMKQDDVIAKVTS